MQSFVLELGPFEIAAVAGVLALVAVAVAVRRVRRRRARVTVRLSVAPDLLGEFRIRAARRPLTPAYLDRLDPRATRRPGLGGRIYHLAQGQRLGFMALPPGTWYVAAAGSVSDPVTDEEIGELREECRIRLGPREAREVIFEVQTRASARASRPAEEPVDEAVTELAGERPAPVEAARAPEPAYAPAPDEDDTPVTPVEALPHAEERYTIEKEIGRGSCGVVFRGYDRRLDRPVALRRLVVSAPLVYGRELMALEHPNIARLYDVAEEGGVCIVSSELVEGETLRARVRRGGAFDVPGLLSVTRPLLTGIAYAHERGVVHGNLGTQNLVLRGDGLLKILDFGLARLVSTAVAPEEEDQASDLRALGACLVELATGAPLEREKGPGEPLRDLPGLPPILEEIIQRLVDPPPDTRFDSAQQVLGLLEWLDG